MSKHTNGEDTDILETSTANDSSADDSICKEPTSNDASTPDIGVDGSDKESVLKKDVSSGKHARTEVLLEKQADKSGKKKRLTLAQKKSRRMRRVLLVVITLVLLLIAALSYFSYQLFTEAQNQASQQLGSKDVDKLLEGDLHESSDSIEKKIEAPDLVAVIGLSQDEALESIGRGAAVQSSSEVNEADSQIKKSVKLALTDEPGDSLSGTPTVYLDLDEDGYVIAVGYTAPVLSLGFSGDTFSKTLVEEQALEKVFAEAGLTVSSDVFVLPEDKSLYSEFASDGKTLVEQKYSFQGDVQQDGVDYQWSAQLRFDYSAANASDDAKKTIRQISIYFGKLDSMLPVPPDEGENEEAGGTES